MESAMEMSLDDYIASFKEERMNSCDKKNTEDEFKAELRTITTDEEDELLAEDVKTSGIWKGPPAETSYIDLDMPERDEIDAMLTEDSQRDNQNSASEVQEKNPRAQQNQGQQPQPRPLFDLRNKISRGNCAKSNMPNFESQQWRLMQPNVMAQRPAGMPPLVPQNALEERRSLQNFRGRNKRRGNNRNGFFQNRNSFGGVSGNGQGYGGCNGHCNFSGVNSAGRGRVQRWNHRHNRNNNNDSLSKNISDVLDILNQKNNFVTTQQARDLTIVRPSEFINLTSTPISKLNHAPPATRSPATNIVLNVPVQEPRPVVNNATNSHEDLRAFLGIDDNTSIKTEMMPMLASKVLDLFRSASQQTIHKPIYDMKIQKEIHEIQKKTLHYKCPGGEVISSDGVGINCEIVPRTSGVSLNHRFA